jgi:hypothetical protein
LIEDADGATRPLKLFDVEVCFLVHFAPARSQRSSGAAIAIMMRILRPLAQTLESGLPLYLTD